jgi:hypothetical protein
MMNAMRPFAGDAMFPKSVCNALTNGMDGRLLQIFKKYYTNHAVLQDLSTTFQRSCSRRILAAMQTAKYEVHSMSPLARDSIGGQAFAANVNAFPSQAECTLDHYSQGGYSSGDGYRSEGGNFDSSCGSRGKLGRGNKCFGCKGPYPYIKNKVIVCPNKDKPGVRIAAKKAYQEWLGKLRKRNKKCKDRQDRPLDFNKLSDRDKTSMRESILTSLCVRDAIDEASTITTDSTHPHDRPRDSCKNSPTKQAKMTILVVHVSVLSSASHKKSIVPAPIAPSAQCCTVLLIPRPC